MAFGGCRSDQGLQGGSYATLQNSDHGGIIRLAARLQDHVRGPCVTLVCLPAEADLINSEGIRVRLPVRGLEALVEIDSRKLPGKVSAVGPAEVNHARACQTGVEAMLHRKSVNRLAFQTWSMSATA